MAVAIRTAHTTWEGPLAGGTGLIRTGSGAAGELPVTWASRTERADGKTSPQELAAAAHSSCYAMALALRLNEHKAVPERPRPAEASLTAVLVLAAAVWIGGLVAMFVVARVAQATLGAAERVAFFRSLGRVYGLVGGVALTAALASGAVLASTYRWDGDLAASAVVVGGPGGRDRRAQPGASRPGDRRRNLNIPARAAEQAGP
jgi:hypothetical protein